MLHQGHLAVQARFARLSASSWFPQSVPTRRQRSCRPVITGSTQDLAMKDPPRLCLIILRTGNMQVVPAAVWLDHERIRKPPPGTPAEIPAKRRPRSPDDRGMRQPESKYLANSKGSTGFTQPAQHYLRPAVPAYPTRETPPGIRPHFAFGCHQHRKHPAGPRLCIPSFGMAFKVVLLGRQSLKHLQRFFVTLLGAAAKVPQGPPEIPRPPQHRRRLALVSFPLRSDLPLAPIEPHPMQGHLSRRLFIAPCTTSLPRLRISGPPSSSGSAISLSHNFDDAQVGK